MKERWVVQNGDLSDPWNDMAWVTNEAATENIANELTPERARLIAAAPEMADVLSMLVEALNQDGDTADYDLIDQAGDKAAEILDRFQPHD